MRRENAGRHQPNTVQIFSGAAYFYPSYSKRRCCGGPGFCPLPPWPPHHSPRTRRMRTCLVPSAAVSSLRYSNALRRVLPPVPVCLGFRMRPLIPYILDGGFAVCQI
jgi:hypothetical protein